MRVLIADDEPLARERLTLLLQDLGGHEVIGVASDGREAILLSEEREPDCILLDVQMPAMDGLEAARHIAQLPRPPAIVFCTAHDEHALAAFDASAIDYIVKPVRKDRLATALERARRFASDRLREVSDRMPDKPRRTHVCARIRGNLRLVPVEDILYFLAEDKYVVVHWTGGEVLIEESLRALEEELGDRFVRIHRNCLLSMERISGLQRLPDGRVLAEVRGAAAPLEVSRRNLPALRKLVREI
ncbi:MAG: LytTR family DNA-binding domain-containing protein [Xanthomonadaceae bacterium]|jgi:two-component system response regulator AlgR|nr:LytTR family DNA-binding domain-containing protein [Xanthomonadaceae bacterium]